ncbi:MAG TPA: hypothetical protein PLC08_01920 [Candidatus Bipolaricaulis sp.]|nr:hypothetical protein [Candidatus Bipolaricaulis sp.]HRS13718.1 hypothetical protein [Candidatus Bipolaricaulis sp.]HRU21574.1 hypothetical protein [Candidatus Bipolaricaulis sp.]
MTKKRIKLGVVLVGALVVLGLLAGCSSASFDLPKTLTAMSIPQGRSATQKITITRTGDFKGEVEFTVTGAPTGMTAKFDPVKTTTTGTETTLTLTVGDAVAVQKYTLKVVATSGKTKKEVPLEVNVLVKPDFTLATVPASLTVKAGASGTVTINLTRNATMTGPIALTLEGAPAGVTGTFNPASVTAATSTLTLNVATTAVGGVYNLTVRGKGDGVDKTAVVKLTVEALPDFSLVPTPTAVQVKPGASADVAIAVNRVGGFAEPVQFEIEGLPTGVTAAFDPNPAPAGTTTLKLTCGTSAAQGAYTVRVKGTAGTNSKVVTINLTIAP